MSLPILVRFVGGPKDGESEYWEGGDYIEVGVFPPSDLSFGSAALPPTAVVETVFYRIDDRPRPGGAYAARVTK